MSLNVRLNFISTYKPLVVDFVKRIRAVQYDKIPEPFLPAYGQLYATAETRIVFVGMETRGYGNITDFVNLVDENPEEAIFGVFEDFDELEFCNWGSNFGNSFWDFNFKFLANFYNFNNWRKIKSGEAKDILKSFAWGNTNSIERYHITAEKNGVDYKNWLTVKQASKCFDNGKYLLDVLQPHIMVILNWETNEEWLINDVDNVVKQEIDDHFWYYFLPTSNTHVLWTSHPTWISKNRVFDNYVKYLADFVKEKMLLV
jgi:hypothetical protein